MFGGVMNVSIWDVLVGLLGKLIGEFSVLCIFIVMYGYFMVGFGVRVW